MLLHSFYLPTPLTSHNPKFKIMTLTNDYLNTKESFKELVIKAYSNTSTRARVRLYNILYTKYEREDISFNKFMKDVSEAGCARIYMMKQRNAGKLATKIFVDGFHELFVIYEKFQKTSNVKSSATFNGAYVYITA
jgi:hypothetical protein